MTIKTVSQIAQSVFFVPGVQGREKRGSGCPYSVTEREGNVL
jgi:hypothetical protein